MNRGDNVHHVIDATGTDGTSALVGLTIAGGQADGTDAARRVGAGVWCDRGGVVMRECRVVDNFSLSEGAGLYVYQGSVDISDSLFQANSGGRGAGAHINRSTARIVGTDFVGNHSSREGGGLAEEVTDSWIEACRFLGNHADFRGGGYYATSSDSLLVNCELVGNDSTRGGGIGTGQHADIMLINATIAYNTAAISTGGIDCEGTGTRPFLSNTILYGNTLNGIADEAGQIHTGLFAGIEVNDSIVQGWSGTFDGLGSFDGDPAFMDADGSDNQIGTPDDNLAPGFTSDAIDAGYNAIMPTAVTTDLFGNPRFIDAVNVPDTGVGTAPLVDIGAREAAADIGGMTCTGDYTGNGTVDFEDMNEVLDGWGSQFDFVDLNTVLDNWGSTCN
ncbi:MAG: hypothetical protein KDA21_11950 [Phycisphaerales bacterium]|nr:hypothetical protein [Phycisphaerales bacterium]